LAINQQQVDSLQALANATPAEVDPAKLSPWNEQVKRRLDALRRAIAAEEAIREAATSDPAANKRAEDAINALNGSDESVKSPLRSRLAEVRQTIDSRMLLARAAKALVPVQPTSSGESATMSAEERERAACLRGTLDRLRSAEPLLDTPGLHQAIQALAMVPAPDSRQQPSGDTEVVSRLRQVFRIINESLEAKSGEAASGDDQTYVPVVVALRTASEKCQQLTFNADIQCARGFEGVANLIEQLGKRPLKLRKPPPTTAAVATSGETIDKCLRSLQWVRKQLQTDRTDLTNTMDDVILSLRRLQDESGR